jgi:hypothetical protein
MPLRDLGAQVQEAQAAQVTATPDETPDLDLSEEVFSEPPPAVEGEGDSGPADHEVAAEAPESDLPQASGEDASPVAESSGGEDAPDAPQPEDPQPGEEGAPSEGESAGERPDSSEGAEDAAEAGDTGEPGDESGASS